MFGQADGIACRSVEMFEAFGFSERVLRESYWVNETTFWGPSPDAPEVITRTGRIQDVADDLSEMPHVILSQARMHDFFLDVMRLSPNRLIPDYNWIFRDLSIASGRDYPVTVRFDHDGKDCSIDAKFVIGCDGAHSAVRRSLGLELDGEAANKAWGVMDVLVDTGFQTFGSSRLSAPPNMATFSSFRARAAILFACMSRWRHSLKVNESRNAASELRI